MRKTDSQEIKIKPSPSRTDEGDIEVVEVEDTNSGNGTTISKCINFDESNSISFSKNTRLTDKDEYKKEKGSKKDSKKDSSSNIKEISKKIGQGNVSTELKPTVVKEKERITVCGPKLADLSDDLVSDFSVTGFDKASIIDDDANTVTSFISSTGYVYSGAFSETRRPFSINRLENLVASPTTTYPIKAQPPRSEGRNDRGSSK